MSIKITHHIYCLSWIFYLLFSLLSLFFFSIFKGKKKVPIKEIVIITDHKILFGIFDSFLF